MLGSKSADVPIDVIAFEKFSLKIDIIMNIIVTIVQLRAPGLTWMRLPFFIWAQLVTSFLLLLASALVGSPLMTQGLDAVQSWMDLLGPGAGTGWTVYPPLSSTLGHPEMAVDLNIK